MCADTGISFYRAQDAIERLINAGVLRLAEKHTGGKPRYELLSWAEVSQADYTSRIAALSDSERRLIEKAQGGLLKPRDSYNAANLATKGFLKSVDGGRWEVVAQGPDPEPDWIWLPNTLISGTDKGEEPPVRRVRRTSDTWVLRLLVDLYYAQNLRDDGGVSPRVIFQKFDRKQIGQ